MSPENSESMRRTQLAMVVSVAAMLGAVLMAYHSSKPQRVQTAVLVQSDTGKPIAHAQVGVNSEVFGLTDDTGASVLSLITKKSPLKTGRIRISADGYEQKESDVVLGSYNVFTLKTLHGAPDFAHETVITSVAVSSGDGDSWGPDYTLCTKPLPDGYGIVQSEAVLSGDRNCGAWAECREIEHNDSRVCWTFRLQGRGFERGPFGQITGGGRTFGVGTLVATIEKPGKSDPTYVSSTRTVCHFYGQAGQGLAAWNRDEFCTIPTADKLNPAYHQDRFTCCGGGASSPITAGSMPPGLELRVTGGYYWSVSNPRLDGDKFYLHTYCGPAAAPGPGCNVDVEVVGHYLP